MNLIGIIPAEGPVVEMYLTENKGKEKIFDIDKNKKKGNSSRRIAFSAVLIALGVALSFFPGSIPIGPVRIFPFQHMINVISGILLGPLFGGFIALSIGVLRIGSGTGSLFAITGGVPGAIVVGLVYRYLWKRYSAAFAEPIGTAIGALLSAALVAPAIGASMPQIAGLTSQWALFIIIFWMASIPGAILGYIIMRILKRSGLIGKQ